MIEPDDDLITVCFKVCTVLDRAGTTVVLVGGSAATFYAPGAYMSHDADYIIMRSSRDAKAVDALREVGYRERNGMYVHASNPYTVEFPPGPLAISEDYSIQPTTVYRGEFLLHIITATDSVRDRLTSYLTYRDYSAFRAAVGIAAQQEVDMERISSWVTAEALWGATRFQRLDEFRRAVDAARLLLE